MIPYNYQERCYCKTLYCKDFPSSDDIFVINNHIIHAVFENLNTVFFTETIEIQNKQTEPATSILLWLNHSCRNISVQDAHGELIFEKIQESISYHLLNITLRNEVPFNQKFDIYITYFLDSIVPEEEYYYFQYYSTINYFTENYHLKFLLPERCLIHYWEDKTSIHPEPESLEFDTRLNRIVVSWSFEDLTKNSTPLFFAYFDPPPPGNHHIWAYVISIILGILTGIAGTYWFLSRRVKRTTKEIGGLFLNESQKVLLKTILEKEGRISQSELCRKTGFSRSKTSRNLISLEENGFIKKERWGKNAIIEITKTGKQVIK
jgi:hypothetical protein